MGTIPEMNYIASQTISSGTVTGGSIPLSYDGINHLSFTNDWNDGGGTLVATISFEASSDPRAFPGHDDYSSAKWTDVTSFFAPTHPTSGAAHAQESMAGATFGYVRMKVAWVSGSGTFHGMFSGHTG